MKPFIIGVGRAGCRIGQLFLKQSNYNGLLADSEESEIAYYQHRHRLLLGKRIADGNGAGGDLALGREIMAAEVPRMLERVESIRDEMDCIVVVSSAGGGTGGAVDILGEELKKDYAEPVYYVGVLPSIEDPARCIQNFSECFKKSMTIFNAVFPADNDLLKDGRRLRPWYNNINEKIQWYLSELLNVGNYRTKEDLGGNVLTAMDVQNTIGGLCNLGVSAHQPTEEQFAAKWGSFNKAELVVSLTQKAVGDMLFPFDMKDSQKALVVVSGPQKYLDFLASIPARLWVEKNIGGVEVRGGDVHSSGKARLEVMVALSEIKRSERIKSLYQLSKMLKTRTANLDKLSTMVERLKALDAKVHGVGEDLRAIHEGISEFVKPQAEEKELDPKKDESRGNWRGEGLYSAPPNPGWVE